MSESFKNERKNGNRYIEGRIKGEGMWEGRRKREGRNSGLVFISVALSKPVNYPPKALCMEIRGKEGNEVKRRAGGEDLAG